MDTTLMWVAGILLLALALLWSGYFMRARTAWETVAKLTLIIDQYTKACEQLRFEFEEFKKGVDKYVEARDERDRIRAIPDFNARLERVLQLFPNSPPDEANAAKATTPDSDSDMG